MKKQNVLPCSPYFTIHQLADGVFAAIATEGTGAWANAGIVDLGGATLIFDTFFTPEAALDLRRAAEELCEGKIAYVLISHFHGDHTFGNQVFPEATIISTKRTRELMLPREAPSDLQQEMESLKKHIEEQRQQAEEETHSVLKRDLLLEIAEKERLAAALPTIKYVTPTITFENRLDLHGTKREVQIYCFGGGHTESDAFLYLPDEKIVFAGDLVLVNHHPMLARHRELRSILEQLQTFEMETVVPGHGAVSRAESVNVMLRYIEHIESVARGAGAEEVEQMPIPDQYADWGFSFGYKFNLMGLFQQLSSTPE